MENKSMRTIVSKEQYAKRKHRSPACVRGWIRIGKISRAAVVGKGNGAQIWVEQADADLHASLKHRHQWWRAHPANRPSVDGISSASQAGGGAP